MEKSRVLLCYLTLSRVERLAEGGGGTDECYVLSSSLSMIPDSNFIMDTQQ